MKEPRVYEAGYLLAPQIKEEDLGNRVDAVRKIITDKGGLPITEGAPELIDLAYPIYKDTENKTQEYTKAFFGWIKFDVSPGVVDDIKKELDALDVMVRNLVITTVREDTRVKSSSLSQTNEKKSIVNDASAVPDEVKPAKEVKEEVEEGEELTEEELDAKIDELAGEE